ncbi:MAG: glycerophosphodiester phosphodiesterase family protein [Sphingomonadales bacterium]
MMAMLKRIFLAGGLWVLLVLVMAPEARAQITRIAFGSCAHQDRPQPLLKLAAGYRPDLFIFLGDNIYGDTDNMDTLRAKYRRWGAKPEFTQLAASTRVLATWDDHDFGRNDAGRHYPYKEASKEIFLDFFKEPLQSERRKHTGIYHAEYLKVGARVVQILLLDNRTFRDDVLLYDSLAVLPRKKYFYPLDYKPHTNKDSTLLGEQQWQWLADQLREPADLRLICSGSQFGIEFNGYEAWANYPHEQDRLCKLIRDTRAEGVLFLTGDVHYGEISRLRSAGMYPLYDITSSGITSVWDFATPNRNRMEGPVMDNNIGLLTISWERDPIIEMELIDETGNSRSSYTIKRSQLSFMSNPVIAHRGAFKKNGFPENSIASLREAIRLNCAGAEFDVRMTADSVLVVNHDAHYNNLTIETTTYAELAAQTLSNGEPLPTLASYLRAGKQEKPSTRLILEIKPTAQPNLERLGYIAESVLKAVKEAGVEDYTEFISFDYNQLLVLKERKKNALVHYLNGDRSPEQVAKDGIDGIDYNFSVFQKNPDWIAQAKRYKRVLNVWTVNDMSQLDWCLQQGFDFITTNEPELLFDRFK